MPYGDDEDIVNKFYELKNINIQMKLFWNFQMSNINFEKTEIE